jgi:hypothetical protein
MSEAELAVRVHSGDGSVRLGTSGSAQPEYPCKSPYSWMFDETAARKEKTTGSRTRRLAGNAPGAGKRCRTREWCACGIDLAVSAGNDAPWLDQPNREQRVKPGAGAERVL